MSGIKFSNTTPAPPSGQSLVIFQNDGQGNVSAAYENGLVLTLTCGANVNAFQGVVVLSDGLAYPADQGTATHAGKFVGVAETSATTGNTIRIRQAGVLNNLGFLFTPGNRIYVGSSGALIQTVPTGLYEQPVGVALSASDLEVDIGPVIVYA